MSPIAIFSGSAHPALAEEICAKLHVPLLPTRLKRFSNDCMGTALANDKERLAAAGTLAVTVSGVTLIGVGSAFWGLCFGLLVLGVERLLRR